jgi:hypothetical protein
MYSTYSKGICTYIRLRVVLAGNWGKWPGGVVSKALRWEVDDGSDGNRHGMHTYYR